MTRRIGRGAFIGPLLLIFFFNVHPLGVAIGSTSPTISAADYNRSGQPVRQRPAEIEAPTISFIDSSTPTCFNPVQGTGICYIQWYYHSVTATAGAYIISLTITIDNLIRAFHGGFFQNSMYIPGNMFDTGFQVTCGAPIAGFGRTYNYLIKARETGGLTSTNTGSVTCPGDVATIFLPLMLKP
jgi:hypothetical protein